MGPAKYAHYTKVRIEEVFSVASIRNAIVDYLLQNHLHSSLAVEAEILTVAGHNLAVLLQTFFNTGAVRAFMLH